METIITLAIGGVLACSLFGGSKDTSYLARDGRRYDHKETPEEYHRRKLRSAMRRMRR